MKKLKLLFLMLVVSFVAHAADEDKAEESSDKSEIKKFYVGEVASSSKYIKVPDQLSTQIEKEFVRKYKLKHKETQKTDVEIVNNIEVKFLNIHASLEQEKSLALEKNTLFEIPRGGGVIDLSQYVVGKTGNFWLKFHFKDKELENIINDPNFSVYFVSNSIKRKLDKTEFGSGCGKYYSIRDYIRKVFKKGKGIKVNATDQRYLSVLAGSFQFIYNDGETLRLATIAITDSRYPHLTCKMR